jgi:hypothetical protein
VPSSIFSASLGIAVKGVPGRARKMFFHAHRFLQRRKMLKSSKVDPSGWQQMNCPWKDEHSNGADTGAAIREPSPENLYVGAFHCCHGHCASRGWQQLTDWINDLAVEEVER